MLNRHITKFDSLPDLGIELGANAWFQQLLVCSTTTQRSAETEWDYARLWCTGSLRSR